MLASEVGQRNTHCVARGVRLAAQGLRDVDAAAHRMAAELPLKRLVVTCNAMRSHATF